MATSATAQQRRPRSLAEVAEWSSSSREFSYHLADFLHHFQDKPELEKVSAEPLALANVFENGTVADAYLAAVAVALATGLGQPRPAWTQKASRFLRQPWFASPSRHLRALLLVESPASFRERNLFVSANALSVA